MYPARVMGSDEIERLRRSARALRDAESKVRILRTIAWPKRVALTFFASGATELPRVEYPSFDAEAVLGQVADVRSTLDPGHPDDAYLLRQAESIENGARLLAATGTRRFSELSRAIYGEPKATILDGITTSLALAERLDRVLTPLDRADLGEVDPPLDARTVAERMAAMTEPHFGAHTPEFELVEELSAKAVAGSRRVRLRRDADYTEADVRQLVMHEVFVHVATSVNGRLQEDLPLLAAAHPSTTRTQEGLAVFSEIVGGSMAPARFRRLAGRVLAIQMALDGADFLDLYRYFLERSDDPAQAFEDAKRVVRGGLVEGGAPFTKDGVYLDGLLRVHHFLRTAVQLGRAEIIPLLFVGKLDLEDLPDLARLSASGRCRMPHLLPPWAKDRQFLVSYLAYAGFLDSVQGESVERHYDAMIRSIER